LYYTASGIITPVGGRPVHRLRGSSLNLCLYIVHKTSGSSHSEHTPRLLSRLLVNGVWGNNRCVF